MAIDANAIHAPTFCLGIDFGTSNTVAMLRWPDGRIRPLLFEGSPLLPSAVFLEPTGRLLVGSDALQHGRFEPGRLEPNPKRHIDEGTCLLGDREVPVVDMIAAVLGHVAAESSRVTNGVLPRTVLTHPAGWGPQRRAILAQAAHRAGFGEVPLVPEPTAAATYFTAGLGNGLAANRCLLVYDLGGGTFDTSLVRHGGTGLEIVTIDGLDGIGGLDFDATIVGTMAVRAATTEPGLHGGAAHRRQVMWDDARIAKEMLSRAPVVQLRLPDSEIRTHLTRDEFEQAVRPLIDRTVTTVTRMLSQARVAPTDVAALLLVGGSSRIPLIGTLLHRATGVAPMVPEQPELVVAEGALLTIPLPERAPAEGPTSPVAGPMGPADRPTSPASGPTSPASGPTSPASGPAGPADGSADSWPPVDPGPVTPAPVTPDVPEPRRPKRSRLLPAIATAALLVTMVSATIANAWAEGGKGQDPGPGGATVVPSTATSPPSASVAVATSPATTRTPVKTRDPKTSNPTPTGTTPPPTTSAPSFACPDVVGETRGIARSMLNEKGLKSAEQAKGTSDQRNVGIVLGQSPSPGATCRKGDTITIVVGVRDAPPSTTPPPVN